MELIIKTFQELTTTELYEILRTREAVFIVEQTCPYPEVDGKDYDAVHLCYAAEDRSVKAYLRLYWKADEPGTVQVGRVVTSADVRGTGMGRKILHDGINYSFDIMGAERLCLHAQVQASGFYAKQGFTISSDIFPEDDIPHVEMRRGK